TARGCPPGYPQAGVVDRTGRDRPDDQVSGVGAPPGGARRGRSGLPEDAVELRAAHGALALRHAPPGRGHLDPARGLTLLLALHAVELTLVGLSHADLRSGQDRRGATPRS